MPSMPSLPSLGSLFSHDDSDFSGTWRHDDGDNSYKVSVDGDIDLSDDDTAIEWMSDDAYFKIDVKRDGEPRIRVEVEPDDDGRPVYRYREGRKTKAFDDEAAELFAENLQFFCRELGFNANKRVRRIYENGGTDAVLTEIDDIESDYSRTRHFHELLQLVDPDSPEFGQAINQAVDSIESDYELSQLMIKQIDYFLKNKNTQQAFFNCLKGIDSDYERASVLKTALDEADLDGPEMESLLEAIEQIDSDYEMAQVLQEVDNDVLEDEQLCRMYFKAVGNIDSDYEKAQVLRSLARDARKHEHIRESYLEAADTIDSDYEYGQVMKALR